MPVEWQLIPDGMYWMAEDGFGITSDVEQVWVSISRRLEHYFNSTNNYHYNQVL